MKKAKSIFDHLAVRIESKRAFLRAKRFAETQADTKMTHTQFLDFLLMDFEGIVNAPLELRQRYGRYQREYWKKRCPVE